MQGQARERRDSVRRRSFRAAGMLLVSVTALLLWSRLKLVTETPRMVYADPEASQPGGHVEGSPAPPDLSGTVREEESQRAGDGARGR